MNIPLLRQIQAQIIQHPESFDMTKWDCGTAACIAGWACRLKGLKMPISSTPIGNPEIASKAQELLGLDEKQRPRLFLCLNWPMEFVVMENAGSKAQAKAAVARIEAFIESGGAE